MNRRLITGSALILTICFILLGIIFKFSADRQKGVSTSIGIMKDGRYIEASSGKMGRNNEKYEALNTSGTVFLILSGITGVIFVVAVVSQKKSK